MADDEICSSIEHYKIFLAKENFPDNIKFPKNSSNLWKIEDAEELFYNVSVKWDPKKTKRRKISNTANQKQ